MKRIALMVFAGSMVVNVGLGETAFLEISQTKLGNIFQEPEPVVFRVKAPANTVDKVVWKVVDFWGRNVMDGSGAYQDEITLRLPPATRGFFCLDLTGIRNDRAVAKAWTTFAVLPPQVEGGGDSSPFGMCTHFGQWWPLEAISLLNRAGVQEIRDDIHWQACETTPGVYAVPEKYTLFMQALKKAGIKPLIVLGFENAIYENGKRKRPDTQASYEAYARFGLALLEKFPELKTLEIWNEWNTGFPKEPASSPRVYADMMKTAYATIKERHPEVTILGGSVTGLWWGGYDWTEKMLGEKDALSCLDGLAIHPYNYWDYPGTEYIPGFVEKLNAIMRKSGTGAPKPIWVTEAGWPVNTRERSLVLSEKLGTSSNKRITSEEMQALYVVRNYVQLLANGVEVCYWYNLINDGVDPGNTEHNFGLLRHADDSLGKFVPKPGYVAYAVMTRLLSGARFQKRDDTSPGVLSFSFGKASGPIHVAWTTTPGVMSIACSGPVETVDIMGNIHERSPVNGTVELPLAVGEPVYITGPVKSMGLGGSIVLPTKVKGSSGQEVVVEYAIENKFRRELSVSLQIEDSETSIDAQAERTTKGVISLIAPRPVGSGPLRLSCRIAVEGILLAAPLIDVVP